MYAKDKIYEVLRDGGGEMSTLEIAALEGTGGRSYVSRILAGLVEEGRVVKRREGKRIYYSAVEGVNDVSVASGTGVDGGAEGEWGLEIVAPGMKMEILGLRESAIWERLGERRLRIGMGKRMEELLCFMLESYVKTMEFNDDEEMSDELKRMTGENVIGEVVELKVRLEAQRILKRVLG